MRNKLLGIVFFLVSGCISGFAQELTAAQHKTVDSIVTDLQKLGKDTKIVEAVKAQNEKLPSMLADMDEKKWTSLASTSPEIQSMTKSDLVRYIRSQVHYLSVIELFVNDAEGRKVALYSKSSFFKHKGKAKHDVPMKGKVWIGKLEMDASTNQPQVQGAFPVLDGKKPIGSIVIGIRL